MTWTAVYTAVVVITLIAALVSRRMGPDIAFLSALAALLVGGVIEPAEAISGFANPAVATVGLLYVVAQGLKETGGMLMVSRRLLGRPKSMLSAQVRLLTPVAVLSALVNNTPIVAMFLPVLSGWAKRHRINAAGLFMPLSFAAMLGGMCTLIGTSTNIVVNGLLVEHQDVSSGHVQVEPMSLFTMSWIGVPLMLAGMAYMLLAGRSLLPTAPDQTPVSQDPRQYTTWMRVEPGSGIAGKTIEQAGLRHLTGLFLAEIQRDSESFIAVGPEHLLREHDRLRFVGLIESVVELQQIQGLVPDTSQITKLEEPRRNRRLIEAVVSEASPLVGRSVRESGFRIRYNAVIIAVHRAGERIRSKIGDIVLRPGDTLLLEGPPGFANEHRNSSAFYLVSELPNPAQPRWSHAWLAMLILVAMVVAIAFNWLDIVTAAMTAAIVMIVGRCLTGTQARQAIDWQVLLVIGSAFGIARAMESSGLAATVASVVLGWSAPLGAHGLLLGVYLITMAFTGVMTNNAAAALVFPIALQAALSQDVPFMPIAVCVAVAASTDFITPIGYQTNLMIMGPGGYTWGDFLRFGGPLSALCCIITVLLAPLAFA